MAALTYTQSSWQRAFQHVPASRLGSWLFSKGLHAVDRQLVALSKDRLSIPMLLAGLPTVILTSIGAKSGQPRRMPLVGAPDGENIILVASNWGHPQNPAWYYNLVRHPEATLEFNGHTGAYVAREVSDAQEYERCWRLANQVYLGYAEYQKRTGGRKIPIFLLTPKA